MTKAEKIKALETELKLERVEHEKTKEQLGEYKKREQTFATAHLEGAEFDNMGYKASIKVYANIAPFGAGNWDVKSFNEALEQFLKKWNRMAQEACLENHYVK